MKLVMLRSGASLALALAAALLLATSADTQDRPKTEIAPNVAHSAAILSVSFSPEGTQIAAGGVNKTVALWDAATWQPLRSLRGHSDDVNAIAFSPDGRHLISASKDETLKLWDVTTGALLQTFVGHTDAVNAVAFSPDGARLVSGKATTKPSSSGTPPPVSSCAHSRAIATR